MRLVINSEENVIFDQNLYSTLTFHSSYYLLSFTDYHMFRKPSAFNLTPKQDQNQASKHLSMPGTNLKTIKFNNI